MPEQLDSQRGRSPSPRDPSTSDPDRWVDDHGDALYRYAILRLRDQELAEEAVQEAFVEALRVRESFAGRSSERTWLIGILRHKILDHFRRRGRRKEESSLAADGHADGPAFDGRGHWRSFPADWDQPGRDIERGEFWAVFGRCLDDVPRGLADAFFLREMDGLDSPSICETLKITPANLWARLHRARTMLRRCLEIHWFGAGTDRA
jgi:RNA polymerase sigma-70 factor (ECF subfamily)